MPELKIERLFRDSLSVCSQMAAPFALAFAIYYVLSALLTMQTGLTIEEVISGADGAWTFLFLSFLLSVSLGAAITAIAWSYMAGAVEPVRNGLHRAVEVLPYLMVAALFAAIGVAFGLILLIIPGVVVALSMAVLTPVVVVEQPGIRAALERSYQLTNGHKMQIFLIWLIVMAAMIIFVMLGAVIITGLGLGSTGQSVLDVITQGILAIFSPVLTAQIYGELAGVQFPGNDGGED